MERSSEFIKNKALFGCFPTQEQVKELEDMGVRYFVDLTCDGEKKIVPYTTNYTHIRYPIVDCRVPTNWKSFAKFLIRLEVTIKSLKKGEKIYVHCKGGHGRAGVVVACLLCYLYNMSPTDALSKTTKYHSRRKEMREKWRRMGSPQTRSQKTFVAKFFDPLYISLTESSHYFSNDFSNDALISVNIPGVGNFPTATAAFYSFKDQTNKEYIKHLEEFKNYKVVRSLKCNERSDWYDIKESVMYTILKYKFEQNEFLKDNLLNTGLRPVILKSSDHYWGKNGNNGQNMFGKLLKKYRKELYLRDV